MTLRETTGPPAVGLRAPGAGDDAVPSVYVIQGYTGQLDYPGAIRELVLALR